MTKITSRLDLPNAMCIQQLFNHDADFYGTLDAAVFGVDTDVSNRLAHATYFKPHGTSTARHPKSSFIPRDKWLKLSMGKRQEILAKRRMELGRPSNGHLQHRIPKCTANACDVHYVVNLDDFIEYVTNTQMTATSHEHGEASAYSPDYISMTSILQTCHHDPNFVSQNDVSTNNLALFFGGVCLLSLW
jgi:hypothetical protein